MRYFSIFLILLVAVSGCRSTVAYYKKVRDFGGEQIDRCFDDLLQCEAANKGKGYCEEKTPNYEPLAEGKRCFIVKLGQEVTKETVRAGRSAQRDMQQRMSKQDEVNQDVPPFNETPYHKIENEPAGIPDPIILRRPEPVIVEKKIETVTEIKTQEPVKIVKDKKKKDKKKTKKKSGKAKKPVAKKPVAKKPVVKKVIEKTTTIEKKETTVVPAPAPAANELPSMPMEMQNFDKPKSAIAQPEPAPIVPQVKSTPEAKPAPAAPEVKPAPAAPVTKPQSAAPAEPKPQIVAPDPAPEVVSTRPVVTETN